MNGFVKLAEGGELSFQSENAKKRNELFRSNVETLSVLAHKIIESGFQNKFVMVCVRKDSKKWRDIVDKLILKNNYGEPIILAGTTWPLCRKVCAQLPELSNAFNVSLLDRSVKAVALDDSGATVYEIKLKKVA